MEHKDLTQTYLHSKKRDASQEINCGLQVL